MAKSRKSKPSVATDKALRFDNDKIRYELIPCEWEEELAKILTRGAKKYADDNWKNSVNTKEHEKWVKRCLGSLRRHLAAWQKGEQIDPELGTYHMGQVAWNALVIMWYGMRKK